MSTPLTTKGGRWFDDKTGILSNKYGGVLFYSELGAICEATKHGGVVEAAPHDIARWIVRRAQVSPMVMAVLGYPVDRDVALWTGDGFIAKQDGRAAVFATKARAERVVDRFGGEAVERAGKWAVKKSP